MRIFRDSGLNDYNKFNEQRRNQNIFIYKYLRQWLIDYKVFGSDINEKFIKVLFDVYGLGKIRVSG